MSEPRHINRSNSARPAGQGSGSASRHTADGTAAHSSRPSGSISFDSSAEQGRSAQGGHASHAAEYSAGSARTVHSAEHRSGSGAASGRAPKRRRKSRVPVWLPLVIVLCIIGAGAFVVIRYVNGLLNAVAPDSGAASIAQEVQTAEEYKGDVVGILLCGIDYSGTETETSDGSNDGLTDMIMYFQFDVKNKKINMLQIPRNTYVGATITCSATTGKTYKSMNGQINAVMRSNTDDNNNPSPAALADVIANNYKLPVDYYATINMDALKAMVDQFHGIEIYVPQTISYRGSKIEEGYHTLMSDEVEFLVRDRHSYADSDISRMNMQRYFYAGLFRRVRSASLTEILTLAPVVANYVTTNMDMKTMISLAVSFLKVDSANIMVCQAPMYTAVDGYKGQSMLVADREDIADLLNTYFRDYTGEVAASELNFADWNHTTTATSPNVQYMGQLDKQADDAVAAGDTTVKDSYVYSASGAAASAAASASSSG